MRFPDQNALKTAVDNCLRVNPTGVACCNHGADCGAAGTAEMADWDVSLVTDMLSLFNGKSQFNADISRWDVSSVTNMQSMFYGANAFDADISRWDVSSVWNMRGMFYSANAFNADISRWDVSSVTNMERMFYQAYAFDADITRWDTSMVTYLFQMFYSATAWKSRFHNCGSDSSSHQACGEVASYASSSGSNDGPPAAWVRKDDACDASTPPDNVRQLHRHPRERHIMRPHVQPRVRAEGRDVVHQPGVDGGFVRLADCGWRRAEGGGGHVPGCGAVGGEVLLLGSQVLVQ